jgi:hypothetical protein
MIRWQWSVPAYGGETMPDFTTVSMNEAKLRTLTGRQAAFMNEYVKYIQQLPKGQAGRLRGEEQENPLTIRRRLAGAAQALGISLVIKRSGQDVYFWSESRGEEQPRRGRPRRGRAGDLLVPNQSFRVPDEIEQGITEEESPELGQTEQVVTDAMRRVDSE